MSQVSIVLVHEPFPAHLATVRAAMEAMGSPTVRVIDIGGTLYAVEGTHRLAAAAEMGVPVHIDVVDDGTGDDDVEIDGLDLDDRSTWTLGDLREYLVDDPRIIVSVEEAE